MTEHKQHAAGAGNLKDPARRLPSDVFRRIFYYVSARDICHATLVSFVHHNSKIFTHQQPDSNFNGNNINSFIGETTTTTTTTKNRKLWKRLLDGDNQAVWKNAVLRRWHSVPLQPVPTGISWKHFYRNRLETEFVCCYFSPSSHSNHH